MEILKRATIMTALLAVMGSGTGCFWLLAGVGAGASAMGYVKGELKSEENAQLKDVFKAAKKALKQLDLPVSTERKDAVNGLITSVNAKDQPVEITLRQITADTTQIKIRVGVWGDERLSRLILAKIQNAL